MARTVALKLRIVNRPNPIVPQHVGDVAYLGGVGIALGIFLSAVTLPFMRVIPWHGVPSTVVLPGVLFLALGVGDDLLSFRPLPKFGLQLAAAAFAVALGNTCAITGIRVLDSTLSSVWILILVNAFNVTDVCDGLVGGLAAISFAILACLLPTQSSMIVVLAGVCAGFLVFNLPPASIFLGDAGSHLLGFLVASFSLETLRNFGSWPGLFQMVLVAGVPLCEVLFLVVVRIGKRIPWWKGSPDHFSLRLQAAGLSRFQTDLLAWSDASLLGAAALALRVVPPWAQVILLGVLVLIHLLFAILLLKWEVTPGRPNVQRN